MEGYRKQKWLMWMAMGAWLLSACSQDSASDMAAGDLGADDSETVNDGWSGMPLDYSASCTAADCRDLVMEGKVESGVPTWHRRAEGVALVGERVVMESVDNFATHPDRDVACYLVRLMGAWDSGVTLRLRVEGEYGLFGFADYEDPESAELSNLPEGHFEWVENVNAAPWKPWEKLVRAIKQRGQMTFRIEKDGEGDARFLYLQISGEEFCDDDAVEVD